MIEVAVWFAFLILGSLAIVLALNLSYWAGQRHEEKQARKYLESLSHLHRPGDRLNPPQNEGHWS
jgi:membrane protein DedA with SNARE-associated domain